MQDIGSAWRDWEKRFLDIFFIYAYWYLFSIDTATDFYLSFYFVFAAAVSFDGKKRAAFFA